MAEVSFYLIIRVLYAVYVPNPWYLLLSDKKSLNIAYIWFWSKSQYLKCLCKLIVDDSKAWFFILGLQKNTNIRTRRHYHLILCMRVSQAIQCQILPLPFIECFKMHRTVCNQHWNDVSQDKSDSVSFLGMK